MIISKHFSVDPSLVESENEGNVISKLSEESSRSPIVIAYVLLMVNDSTAMPYLINLLFHWTLGGVYQVTSLLV